MTQPDKTDHPFQPGVRVAIREPHGFDAYQYIECFVEKTYKTGRFTLKGGNGQQWRPNEQWDGDGEPPRWIADVAGPRSWGRMFLWDDRTDAEIRANNDRITRGKRFMTLQNQIARMRFNDSVTTDMLDKLEAALRTEEEVKHAAE